MKTDKITIELLHPTSVKGKSTIEIRVYDDGSNEAFILPHGATPVATGIQVTIKNEKLFINCRIRKKQLKYKPEEIVRQMVLNRLIDQLNYTEDQIGVEVGIVMGSTVHSKPADIVVFLDKNKTRHWIIVPS